MLPTGLGPLWDHLAPSRARPHLGFETLHVIKSHPLVIPDSIGHLLVLDSVLLLPGADLQERSRGVGKRSRFQKAPAHPQQKGPEIGKFLSEEAWRTKEVLDWKA